MKERLTAVPKLTLNVHVNGKDVLLSYKNDISTIISCACESSFDSDAVVLAKAAKIVHREIFDYQNQFDETLAKTVLKHLHRLYLFNSWWTKHYASGKR